MDPLPSYFGIFRPGYENAEYFCLAKVEQRETIGGVEWQPISFVEDPPLFEDDVDSHVVLKSRVMWHRCNRRARTLRNMKEGQTFHHLPFKVKYQDIYYPVFYSVHTSWLPGRVPEPVKYILNDDSKFSVREEIYRLYIRMGWPIHDASTSSESESEPEEEPEPEPVPDSEPNPQPNSDIPMFVYENHLFAEQSKGTQCAITMTELIDCDAIALLKDCFHIFEKNALMQWYDTNQICPTCRAPVTGMLYYEAREHEN